MRRAMLLAGALIVASTVGAHAQSGGCDAARIGRTALGRRGPAQELSPTNPDYQAIMAYARAQALYQNGCGPRPMVPQGQVPAPPRTGTHCDVNRGWSNEVTGIDCY
jgi:hypothetical protein